MLSLWVGEQQDPFTYPPSKRKITTVCRSSNFHGYSVQISASASNLNLWLSMDARSSIFYPSNDSEMVGWKLIFICWSLFQRRRFSFLWVHCNVNVKNGAFVQLLPVQDGAESTWNACIVKQDHFHYDNRRNQMIMKLLTLWHNLCVLFEALSSVSTESCNILSLAPKTNSAAGFGIQINFSVCGFSSCHFSFVISVAIGTPTPQCSPTLASVTLIVP